MAPTTPLYDRIRLVYYSALFPRILIPVESPGMVGRTLAHYEITGLLGKGGMGEVYRARDTKLGRDVALKVLPAEMASDPTRLSRFSREAKTVAGLNHPNIVTLYSVDEADGIHFLTMELVEGQPLDAVLPEGGLDVAHLLDLGISISDALAEAHAQGIIHRDLKPGNVMVTDVGGRIKVLDFGLAKLSAADGEIELESANALTTTQPGALVGTPFYMSPEQARSGEIDHRTDLFALGIMLYRMATGERPFRGSSTIELLSSVLKDEPRPVSELRPELPAGLEEIIRRCLEKDPEARYGSARELSEDLKALRDDILSQDGSGLDHSRFTALRTTEDAKPQKPRAGRKVRLAGVVLLVLAAAALLKWAPFKPGPATDGRGARPILAVLPFENLGSAEDAYFAVGITDEIRSRLSMIQQLGIISRTSMRVYEGTRKTVREIGDELNSDYVLEGTIRWDHTGEAGRVRISPRLIRVTDDTQVWTENYEQEVTGIFDLQAEIASRIAQALDVTLALTEQRALDARPTGNIDAYQAFLQGMKQLNSPGFGREQFELGVQMFERAARLDPDFALAQARLASMNARMYHYGFDRSESRLERARAAAERSLELQPELAEAHLALGHYYYWGTRDYGAALAAFGEAGKLAPNNNEIWLNTAYVKRRQGDFGAAIELFERDLALNPRDPNAVVGLGETLGTLRRYPEAKRAFERGIALAPNDPYPYTELALLHLRWQGDAAAARAILAEMPQVNNSEGCRVSFLVELFDRRYEAALERLRECPGDVIEAGAFYIPVSLYEGLTYRLMGDAEKAPQALETAKENLEARLASAPDDPRVHSGLGLALAGLGQAEAAQRHGRRAVELAPLSGDALEAPVQLINLALIYTLVGDADSALKQLDAALSIPSILSAAWLQKDPFWDDLRDNAGFLELIRRHRSGT